MNSITLSGNLTADPRLTYSRERPICEMRLAVDNGSRSTTFIDVRTFDEQAYICAEYLAKGRKVGVIGRLVYDEWLRADGSKASSYSVIGDVEFLDRPPVVMPESGPGVGAQLEVGACGSGQSATV